MKRLEALSSCAVESANIDCQVVCISPPVAATSEWPSQLEVTCRVETTTVNPLDPNLSSPWKTIMSTSFSAYKWVMTADASEDDGAWGPVAATSCAYSTGSHAMEGFVTLRFEVPALTPGFKRISVWPSPSPAISTGLHSGLYSSEEPLCSGPTAVNSGSAPFLVTPSSALSQELQYLFIHMKDLVFEEQLQQQANRQQGSPIAAYAPPVSAAATECWTEHFMPLLADVRNVLSFASDQGKNNAIAQPCRNSPSTREQPAFMDSIDPGYTAGLTAGRLLSSVMEFLAMHGCWCSVSYVLAEAYKKGLLACPGVTTAVQMKQARLTEQLGQAAYNSTGGVVTSMILSVASVTLVAIPPTAMPHDASAQLPVIETCSSAVMKHSTNSKPKESPLPAPRVEGVIQASKSIKTTAQQYSVAALLLTALLAIAVLLWQSATQAICVDVVFNGSRAAQDPVQQLYCLLFTAGLLSVSAAYLRCRGAP